MLKIVIIMSSNIFILVTIKIKLVYIILIYEYKKQ